MDRAKQIIQEIIQKLERGGILYKGPMGRKNGVIASDGKA